MSALNPNSQAEGLSMKTLLNMILGVKIILAFLTIPHNATALGIVVPGEGIVMEVQTIFRVLGLLVYEGTFITTGFLIAKGMIKGEYQGVVTWVIYAMSLIFMSFNGVLALALERAHESGQPIGDALIFYQVWIAPTTAIILAGSLSLIGYTYSEFVAKRMKANHDAKEDRIKLNLEIAKAEAASEQEKIKLRNDIAIAEDKADELEMKLDAQSQKRQAESQLEVNKVLLDTEVKKRIAEADKAQTEALLESPKFQTMIKKKSFRRAEALMDEYLGSEEERDPNG